MIKQIIISDQQLKSLLELAFEIGSIKGREGVYWLNNHQDTIVNAEIVMLRKLKTACDEFLEEQNKLW